MEFGLVLLPLLAFVFLLMDTSWIIFARATLQHAAAKACGFGVTGQIVPPASCLRRFHPAGGGHEDAFGFVPSSQASSMVAVTYYNPSTLAGGDGHRKHGGGQRHTGFHLWF